VERKEVWGSIIRGSAGASGTGMVLAARSGV
jgi:hypothetical protein